MNDAFPNLETDPTAGDLAVPPPASPPPPPAIEPPFLQVPLPPDAELIRGLARVFGGPVALRERARYTRTSTYPSELITLESCGVVRRVLCKYSAGYDEHRCWGHRGGLEREARVYLHVLPPLGATEPACHGAYEDPVTGWIWLVLEYLDDAVRLHQVDDPVSNLLQAAAWLGRFHAAGEDRLPAAARRYLPVYDADYYEGWVRRTLEYSAPVHERFPWLPAFCPRAIEFLATLLDRPQTVIHGEFYVKNILHARGRVCPVDWESAALGTGEIDLISLVEGWSPEDTLACVREYCRHRWPGGGEPDLGRAMAAAEMYFLFRWLGGEPEYAGLARASWRYGRLFELGREWGLIPVGTRVAFE